jgi:hypothetical protein
MTTGELLKFIGVLILGTRFEFCRRADLWKTEATSRLFNPPAFGRKTGMSRGRFDNVWSCLTTSRQGVRMEDQCSAEHRWQQVADISQSINSHIAAKVTPSGLICVDESMFRWYGQGWHWVEHGLPHYVAIDRKPENGCEVQKAACGRSGIMLQLQLVKTAYHEATASTMGLSSWSIWSSLGTAKDDRIVCADSYFALASRLRCILRLAVSDLLVL